MKSLLTVITILLSVSCAKPAVPISVCSKNFLVEGDQVLDAKTREVVKSGTYTTFAYNMDLDEGSIAPIFCEYQVNSGTVTFVKYTSYSLTAGRKPSDSSEYLELRGNEYK